MSSTTSRSALALVAAVFVCLLAAPAAAQSKQELIDGFAHIKHGQLYLCSAQGSQHSIGSHSGWAKGQSEKALRMEILSQMFQAYDCLVRNPSLAKSEVDLGFAYIKHGALILTGQNGPQHSIGSHSGWARGQAVQTVRSEITAQLKSARGKVLSGL